MGISWGSIPQGSPLTNNPRWRRRAHVGRGVRTDVSQAIHGSRRGSSGRVTSVRSSSPAGCDCPAVTHSGFAPRLGHGSRGGLRVPRRVQIPAMVAAELAPRAIPWATDARLREGTLEGVLDPRPDHTPPNIVVSTSEIWQIYTQLRAKIYRQVFY